MNGKSIKLFLAALLATLFLATINTRVWACDDCCAAGGSAFCSNTMGGTCSNKCEFPNDPNQSGCTFSCNGSGGGGGGGGACQGCQNGNQAGLYSVIGLTVSKISSTVAKFNWAYTYGQSCAARGRTIIIIGTSLGAVNNRCGQPADKPFPWTTLQSGCSYATSVSGNVTSYNTSGQYNLDPNTVYYARVETHLYFTSGNGGNTDNGNFCGGQDVPFLGQCTVSPPTANMSVGGQTVTFTTDAYDSLPGLPANPTVALTNWVPPSWKCPHNGDCTWTGGSYQQVWLSGYSVSPYSEYPYITNIKIVKNGNTLWNWSGNLGAKNVVNWTIAPAGFPQNPNPRITAGNITVWYTQNSRPNNVDHVTYVPSTNFSVAPATTSDSANRYPTVATAVSSSNGVAKPLAANVYAVGFGQVAACTSSAFVTSSSASSFDPWWQVKDSDVQANGDLGSVVPGANFFGLPGPGNFPGVAAYTGTTNLTGSNVSSKGWLAKSPVTNAKTYNYDYFANLIPSDVLTNWTAGKNGVDPNDVASSILSGSAVADSNGYYWFKYDGNVNPGVALNLNQLNVGSKKVILMIANADLNITGSVNVTDGQGFFMVIVNGNITVDPTKVGGAGPDLEGLYFADGTFDDGTKGGGTDSQLWLRGSLVSNDANTGIILHRDLGGAANASPAELFEFAPDQIMLFPKAFGTRKISWKEVAP